MNSNLILAIIWTIALVSNVILCIAGEQPSWWSYFCTNVVLVLSLWERYFDEQLK